MDVCEKMLYDVMLEELEGMSDIKITYSANFFGRCALFRFVGSITVELYGGASMADVVERLAGNEQIGRPYTKVRVKPAGKDVIAYKSPTKGDWMSRKDQVFLTTNALASEHLKDEGYEPVG